jgi:hypothetical protein
MACLGAGRKTFSGHVEGCRVGARRLAKQRERRAKDKSENGSDKPEEHCNQKRKHADDTRLNTQRRALQQAYCRQRAVIQMIRAANS